MPLTAPGKFKTDGANNSFGGNNTGVDFLTGVADNTLVGFNAGTAITTAIKNTVVGSQSGKAITTSPRQTVVGQNNLIVKSNAQDGSGGNTPNTDGSVVLGNDNLLAATVGPVIALGCNILNVWNGTSNSQSVLIGYNIGGAFPGGTPPVAGSLPAVSIGINHFVNAGGGSPSYTGDVLIGTNVALAYQGHGANGENIAIGLSALQCQGSGTRTPFENVAIGNGSLSAITTGGRNVALGYQAHLSGTTVTDNVAVGSRALRANTGGSRNTSVGAETATVVAFTGSDNVFAGYRAAFAVTSASFNVLIGRQACLALTTGLSNTVVGDLAGSNLTTGSNNVVVGDNVAASSATVNNEINIGGVLKGTRTASAKVAFLDGGLRHRIATYLVSSQSVDETIVQCNAANITITLPTGQIVLPGRMWIIKDGSGAASILTPITIVGQGGETFDGAASETISTAFGSLVLYSDGTALRVIARM